MSSPQQRLARQRLPEARRLHRQATKAAQVDPGNHELRTKAFALGATVKLIEALADGD